MEALEFTLGDRMRKAREAAGFDKVQMAALIGIHRDSVTRYECGTVRPKFPILAAWALASGVTIEWIEADKSARESEPFSLRSARIVGRKR